MHDISSSYYVDLTSKASRDLADLSTEEEPLEHAILKTKFAELQKRCRHVDVVVSLSLPHLVNFAFERMSAPVANDVYCTDPLRRNAELYKL